MSAWPRSRRDLCSAANILECHEPTPARFTGRGCSPKLVETLARRLASLATGTLAYDLARTAQTVRQATM